MIGLVVAIRGGHAIGIRHGQFTVAVVIRIRRFGSTGIGERRQQIDGRVGVGDRSPGISIGAQVANLVVGIADRCSSRQRFARHAIERVIREAGRARVIDLADQIVVLVIAVIDRGTIGVGDRLNLVEIGIAIRGLLVLAIGHAGDTTEHIMRQCFGSQWTRLGNSRQVAFTIIAIRVLDQRETRSRDGQPTPWLVSPTRLIETDPFLSYTNPT